MDITFAIVSYNQEKLIIEALESVKYQVQRFLTKKKVQLIVSDDCSSDNTVYNIRKWIEQNQTLFTQIDILESEINVGTCRNVGKAYRLILADRFVLLAGDDILSNVDIFSIICRYAKDTIVACAPDYFSGRHIVRDRERYRQGVIPYFFSKEQLLERSRRDSAISNGGFYSSDLLNEDILTFMEKFQLLDDQARYFYMLENNKKIKYDFCNEPLLLYRLSDQQVTNRKGKYYKTIIKDKSKLIKYTMKAEPKFKNRISIFLSFIALKYPVIYAYLLIPMDVAVRTNIAIAERYDEKIEEMINERLRDERVADKESYLQYIYDKALLSYENMN